MKILRFLLTLFISISISQAYSQGMNNANSGQAAVEGFLETSMAKYAIESKELLSYILPSFMASSTCDKVNMYTRIWKYDIEKSQGNFFYVAVFTSPGNRSACILYTFQTQEENGYWYLVPSGVGSYDETFVLPYSDQLHSERSDYVPGSGPYVHTGTSDFQTMNNTNSGYAAVEGFMETAMAKYNFDPTLAKYAVDSEEMLSYILPSFMVNNSCDKIDMWTKVWKYNIEKTQGNFFYVAIYMEPNYKSSCTLVTFQTQEENGHWYLVPGGVNRYSDEYLDPWVERSADANYIPGTGPYEYAGAPKESITQDAQTDDELWSFLDDAFDFDTVCNNMLEDLLEVPDRKLVKSWDMGYPYGSFRGEMRSLRSLYMNELAQYYIPFDADSKYFLIVFVNDKNLKPRVTVSFTPQNDRLLPKEDFYGGSFFPFTSLIFAALSETEEMDIRGFVEGDGYNTSKHRLRAFLFKQPK